MSQEAFLKLKSVIAFLWDHPNPFYRTKWQKAGFSPDLLKIPADVGRIPFLTRGDLVAAQRDDPLAIVYSADDLAYVRTTGMTTLESRRRQHPDFPAHELLFMPLSSRLKWQKEDPFFRQIRGPMFSAARLLLIEHSRRMVTDYLSAKNWQDKEGVIAIGDILNPEVTAKIALRLKVNAITAPAAAFFSLMPHLEAVKFPTEDIRFLTPHAATRIELQALRHFFPKAKIVTYWGMSELDGLGSFLCPETYSGDFDVESLPYHPSSRNFVEIVDPETSMLMPLGQSGELIISHLDTYSPLPLIRYRTGDKARIRSARCGCGFSDLEMNFEGRLRTDVIRVSGAILTLDDFRNAVLQMNDLVEEKFLAKISQERQGWRVRAVIELEVLPRERSVSAEAIAVRFSQLFRVSPRFTLEDAIASGLFAQPRVKFLSPQEYRDLDRPQLVNGLEY